MAKHSLLMGLLMLSGVSISACDRNSGNDAPENDPFAARSAGNQDDQFGKGFGKAHRADPNSEPVNIADVELAPVTATGEPVPID